ncbi:WXG100 family type VII secretion target [Streptomyces sp. SCUT-3]|uniref:WXG100 family type VII secretion target n=1 Tax=Streptomyces sp. SCUT-3 TaxID=2684469 RepID=UPI002175638D|nr:WXG100 family type VII secretion target [Streptomyces sp. SCUT-3]
MAGGPGCSIRNEGAGRQAGDLDKAADDIGDAKKAVEDGVCYVPATFGGTDSGAAYNAFSAAWQAEAQTIKDALREQADKIRASTANYNAADKGVISSMNTAVGAAGAGAGAIGAAGTGGGGGDLGMPGVSTRPVHAQHRMIRYGLSLGGAHRTALFGDGAVAGAVAADRLGVQPRSVAFLAEVVRSGGAAYAAALPEPLPGGAPSRLAGEWLDAASSVVRDVDGDETAAR